MRERGSLLEGGRRQMSKVGQNSQCGSLQLYLSVLFVFKSFSVMRLHVCACGLQSRIL